MHTHMFTYKYTHVQVLLHKLESETTDQYRPAVIVDVTTSYSCCRGFLYLFHVQDIALWATRGSANTSYSISCPSHVDDRYKTASFSLSLLSVGGALGDEKCILPQLNSGEAYSGHVSRQILTRRRRIGCSTIRRSRRLFSNPTKWRVHTHTHTFLGVLTERCEKSAFASQVWMTAWHHQSSLVAHVGLWQLKTTTQPRRSCYKSFIKMFIILSIFDSFFSSSLLFL